MKVTILQTDIEWGSPKVNIERAEQLMGQAPDSDLYILPEMWSTGFATEPFGIAEEESVSVALEWMKSKAQALHCAICGSLAIRVDGTYRNRHEVTEETKVAEVKKDTVAAQPAQPAVEKTGYCLVLASHVSKKNAQAFVDELHKRGFTEAEIFVRNNVTRVVYGHFETMNAAYNRLNRVRDNKGFEEAWVLKLKDKV